ncbi:MAG: type II toxin-antitoxin system HicA family toxin [Paludibacteraceae bacterium]|nr:type II toxin-antitoxin system HicA family toxin [Paludibacteraceae bacterium]
MKKEKLLKHLRQYNCYPTGRQKGSHAQFKNLDTGEQTIIPIHNEISDILAKKICKQLGIPVVGNN